MAKSTSTSSSSSDLSFVATCLGRIFLAGALGISLYLGITSIMAGSIAGCSDGGDCHDLLASRWGYFFGIPVSFIGAATYLTLLGSDIRGCCPRVHAVCRWLILLAAVWFVGVQVMRDQFCPWCSVTHTLAVLGALFLWKRTPRSSSDNFAGHRHFAPIFSLVAMAGFILAQSVGPERPTTAGASLAEGQGASVSQANDKGPRTVSLHGGQFVIDVEEFPAIGNSQTAEHVAVGLFVFTCPHCRELTEILTPIQKEFGQQLAIVQLPGYYDAAGETIHRLLLPVWKEDPETYNQLAHLLHEETLPATEAEVRAAIGSLVDPDAHRSWTTKHEAWISKALAQSQAILAANREIINTGKFPQLMVSDYIEAGSKKNPGHYYQLFKDKFGITRSEVPKLDVQPQSISLGEIIVGTPHSFALKLTNPDGPTVHLAAPQLLRGMRLKPGYAEELASGQSTVMEFEAIPPAAGTIKGEIAILSDAEPAAIKIPVEAQAKHVFQATPSFANLGMFRGRPLSGKIDLKFIAPVKLGTPRIQNPKEFRAALTEVEPGLQYELAITANPNPDRIGLHQTSIAIPVEPIDAQAAWPKQIRVAARCQVPSNGQATPRTGAPQRPQRTTPARPPIPPVPTPGQNDVPE